MSAMAPVAVTTKAAAIVSAFFIVMGFWLPNAGVAMEKWGFFIGWDVAVCLLCQRVCLGVLFFR